MNQKNHESINQSNDQAKDQPSPTAAGENTAENIRKVEQAAESRAISRRTFFGRVTFAGVLGAGMLYFPRLLGGSGQVAAQSGAGGCEIASLTGTARADYALGIRKAAAAYERNMPIPLHPCNGDEALYANRNYFASSTKGILRNSTRGQYILGEVDPSEYAKLLTALKTGDPADFELIQLGFMNNCTISGTSLAESRLSANAFQPNQQRRLESPQAGLNYDLEGKDYYQLINRPIAFNPRPQTAFPPAYTFNSSEEAVEIIENYWQALTRDVAFINYGSDPTVAAAAADLSNFTGFYYGPLSGGAVTPAVYSRGILKGDNQGPFISQFLLRDVPYGAQTISARIRVPLPDNVTTPVNNDFMTDAAEWRMIQTGQTPDRKTAFDKVPRYIRSGRDLAEYVHNDAIYQAYLNAALIMMTERDSGGLGIPVNQNNPYNQNTGGYCKQQNFVEFGPSQLLSVIGEVSVRAHKAVWYQKWNVHRRLRPEEFGGRVHFNYTGESSIVGGYPVNGLFNRSNVNEATLGKFGTLLLPQAFPEGSPVHPSYGAGHATLAGACVTILKAWFNSEMEYPQTFAPLAAAAADGLTLQTVPAVSGVTVADELNKLASNVSIARNIAGVHWRSDYTESVYLGEQVAIQLLEDYGYTYNEQFNGFVFRNFDGQLVTIGSKRLP